MKKRPADGYAGEPHAVCQALWDPSNQHLSVVDGLEAADDCRMDTSESCRKTPGSSLRILLDSVGPAGLPLFGGVPTKVSL